MNNLDSLVRYKIITDVFDYDFLDNNLKENYSFFETRFNELFKHKAELFNLKDCYFLLEK